MQIRYELRTFARMSERSETFFPRLPFLLLLDGLYANGPVTQRRRQYHWQLLLEVRSHERILRFI